MMRHITKINIVGSFVNILTKKELIITIKNWSYHKKSRCVCFCNVHMIMEAYDNEEFAHIVNSADLICADGRPVYWMQKLLSSDEAEQILGPETMKTLLLICENESLPIALYGSSENTLKKLNEKIITDYPKLQVAIAISPPFAPLSEKRLADDAEKINMSGAKLLFVSLGCPKQEKWISCQKGKIHMPMLAVGAAFDFIAGAKKEAPKILRYLGLEWFFRLINEPKRLWKRYIFNNPRFILLAIKQIITSNRK